MKVTITQEMIDKAERYNCDKCVVALAINEVLNDNYRAEVGMISFFIKKKYELISEYHMPLPQVAYDYRVRFDKGETVEPTSFEIHIPQIYLK